MSDYLRPSARSATSRIIWPSLLAAGFAAFAVQTTRAQTFEELEARLAGHPSVAALRRETDAREELSVAARGLPDPTISFGVNNVPLSDPGFDRIMMTNKAIGVRQEIPGFGVRSARAERERSEARASELRADYQLSRLRAELISALAEKERLKAQLGYAAEKLQRYEELEGVLRGELEAGRPIYFRLSEVDVERADVDRSIAELRADLAAVDAALVDLVESAPDTPPPPTEPKVWNGEALALYAARIADAGVETAEAGVAEGKAEFGPDFGVQFTYHQREEADPAFGAFNGDDWFSAGVTFSVPLWAPKNQAPRLRAAKARAAGARASYQTSYRDAREQLTALAAGHAAATRSISILERKAAALGEVIAAAKRNYEAGRGDYVQVLDAEIGRLTLLSEVAAERARATTLAARANSQLVTP